MFFYRWIMKCICKGNKHIETVSSFSMSSQYCLQNATSSISCRVPKSRLHSHLLLKYCTIYPDRWVRVSKFARKAESFNISFHRKYFNDVLICIVTKKKTPWPSTRRLSTLTMASTQEREWLAVTSVIYFIDQVNTVSPCHLVYQCATSCWN